MCVCVCVIYNSLLLFFFSFSFRMKEIVEDIKPFVEDRNALDDIYRIIVALESMDIFKNLGLLEMKCMISRLTCFLRNETSRDVSYSIFLFSDVIRDMFDNWDVVKSYLVDKIGISNDVAVMLSQAKIDMISVFMKERRVLGFKEIICSPKKLDDILNFIDDRITAEEVSAALCQLEDSQTKNVTTTLIKNLNFQDVFKTVSNPHFEISFDIFRNFLSTFPADERQREKYIGQRKFDGS